MLARVLDQAPSRLTRHHHLCALPPPHRALPLPVRLQPPLHLRTLRITIPYANMGARVFASDPDDQRRASPPIADLDRRLHSLPRQLWCSHALPQWACTGGYCNTSGV
jgi:hypothetical protein